MRLAVLVSGTGSILRAILEYGIPVKLVIADRECRALEVAREAGVPTILLPRAFGPRFDREQFTRRTIEVLQEHRIGFVAMVGFMTIFSEIMFTHNTFRGRMMNTHPSLLPLFPGPHAIRDALAAGVKTTGYTIHLATAECDAGPILLQKQVPIMEGDTEGSLHERIKKAERKGYPKILETLSQLNYREGQHPMAATLKDLQHMLDKSYERRVERIPSQETMDAVRAIARGSLFKKKPAPPLTDKDGGRTGD